MSEFWLPWEMMRHRIAQGTAGSYLGGPPAGEQPPGEQSPGEPKQPQGGGMVGVYGSPSNLGDIFTGPSSDNSMAALGAQILSGEGTPGEQPATLPQGPSNMVLLVGAAVVAFVVLTVLR